MHKRPTLAQMASLKKDAVRRGSGQAGERVTAGAVVIDAVKISSAPAVARSDEVARGAPLPHSLDDDAPPASVIDDSIDASVLGFDEPLPSVPVQKPANELEFVAELTANDKIEAVCTQLNQAVRSFIEDELRGRFVAVQVSINQPAGHQTP